jgi:RNA polymerase sigma factor for flagellar operon FliA
MAPEPPDLPPEQLFLEHLPFIEKVIEHSCRRYHLSREEVEDFSQQVMVKLIDDEYAVFRKFKGTSSLKTYLTTVVKNYLFDYIDHLWGKARASEEAKRLGPVAMRLERLVRDGFTLDEACEILRTNYGVELSREELVDLWCRLPRRTPRQMKGEEELENVPAGEVGPEEAVRNKEREARHEEIRKALVRILDGFPAEDRVIIRMWMDGFKIVDIAKARKLEQKPLYRRIEKILKDLRKALQDEGFGPDDIEDLL